MERNSIKHRLANGETVVGCFIRYPSATLAEYVSLGGWDFVVFDAEHGSLQPRDVEELSRAAELHGVTPMVRVTTNDAPTILRFLDAGAHGLQVPWVNSGEEADAAVRAAKYLPRGSRGLAATRAAGFAMNTSIAEYVRRANDETLVVVQVETAVGVDNVEEIAAVDGVDVVFLGPTDLAHSLGHVGDAGHPEVQQAMDRVAGVVAASGKALGIFVSDPAAAATWRNRGARYLATGLEPLLRHPMEKYLSTVRRAEGDTP